MSPFHLTPGLFDAAQPDLTPSPDQGPVSDASARRPSTQGEIMLDQKLRSGSPHLHPFFQTGAAAVPATAGLGWNESSAGPRAYGSLFVNAWNSGRRYSSADLVLYGVKARAGVDGAGEEQAGRGNEMQGTNQKTKSQTISQSLLGPAQTRPTLLVSTVPKSPSPLSSKSVITVSSCEDDTAAAEQQVSVANFDGLKAPAYPEKSDSGRAGKASVPVSPRTAPMTVASNWDGDAGPGGAIKVPSPTDRVPSSASSVASNSLSDACSSSSSSSDETADTEATSPERSPDGDETPIARVPDDLEKTFKRASRREPPRGRRRVRASTGPDVLDRYGTPEMPRGSAKFPHIPASAGLTPRMPGHQGHVKHLPRAEKLPMSGYELLASTISSSPPCWSSSTAAAVATPSRLSTFVGSHRFASRRNSAASLVTTSTSSVRSGSEEAETELCDGAGTNASSANLKPIYRRFEALNHRMLLHLQDELSELEEQLHRLDTTDTQTRRLPSRILPASRRAEHQAGGELQWHKADILGKIGFKLGQYNHVLSSFAATRDLPAPSSSDVNEYRSYLTTHQPITEVETRFIDTVDDLVTLAASRDKDQSSPPSSAPVAAGSEQSSPPPVSAKLAPSAVQEHFDTFRMPQPREKSEDAVLPPFPTVTPIPGTMHGNSWLTRHNRLPSSSSTSQRGHSRTQSHPIVVPRVTNRRASMASFQLQQQRQRQMSHAPFSRSPPWSPLKQQEDEEEIRGTSHQVPHHRLRPETATMEPATIAEHPKMEPSVSAAVQDGMAVKSTVSSSIISSETDAHVILHVVTAMAVAVLIPVLSFSAVPGFAGRISIALLVGLSAMGSVVQSGVVKKSGDSNADVVCIAAVYAAVMAVVAGVIG